MEPSSIPAPSKPAPLKTVTLADNVTFGGTGRWDIRGTSASLSTGGNAFTITKVGTNQVSLVATAVDAALGDININQGILAFQTSTSGMGDAAKTLHNCFGRNTEFL